MVKEALGRHAERERLHIGAALDVRVEAWECGSVVERAAGDGSNGRLGGAVDGAKRGEIVSAFQARARRAHGSNVKRRVDDELPRAIVKERAWEHSARRRGHKAIQIVTSACRKPGMERRRLGGHTHNRELRAKSLPPHKVREPRGDGRGRRRRLRKIKVNHLRQCMDACVGSAGAHNIDGRRGELGDRRLEHVLHRGHMRLRRLRLPAAESTSDVGNNSLEPLHSAASLRLANARIAVGQRRSAAAAATIACAGRDAVR
eukprot:Amastigsp_a681011_38.p2 type:complete len:260 gc:universal Amastigsp_a681011_38:818-39(-)